MELSWPCDLGQPPRLAQAWVGRRQNVGRQRHHLVGLWQLHIYWHGGELEVWPPDGATCRTALSPGCLTILPPDSTSAYRVPEAGVFTAVHFALALAGGASCRLPFLTAPGGRTEALQRRLHAACALATHQSAHGTAELWSALWELATSADAGRRGGSRLVAQARELIESTLAEPLPVAALARRLAVSPAHLRRLFVAETGQGVKRYQLTRRLERARHLLVHSDRSPASIAAEIGMPDAHQFNKAVRREFGSAPTRLRPAPA